MRAGGYAGRLGGEDQQGQVVQRSVGFREFGWQRFHGREVCGDDAAVAASERAGPGGAGTETFKIFENLTSQLEEGANGFVALHAG